MAIAIKKKITGVAVVKEETPKLEVVPTDPPLPDECPLTKRIENRPDMALNATIEKVSYHTQFGRKKIYIAVSYLNVEGRLNGETIQIERPIEVFLPAGQTEDDGQWIVATMRNLSLAARGGYLTRALQDLRQVPWTNGPVRCGTEDFGNGKEVPINHPSEVAAIAYAIQRILKNKGFLDAEGNQVPVEVLVRRFKKERIDPEMDELSSEQKKPTPTLVENDTKPSVQGKTCKQCGSNQVVRLDGCDTCLDCGDSKCG